MFDHRYSFGFHSPNLAGMTFLCLLALLLPWLDIHNSRLRQIVFCIILTISSALIVTLSRGALIGIMVAGAWKAFCTLPRQLKQKDNRIFLLPTVFGFILFGYHYYSNHLGIQGRLTDPLDDVSVSTRFSLWGSALKFAYDSPWSGVPDFGEAYSCWINNNPNHYYPRAISNPIQLLSTRGFIIFGMCIFTSTHYHSWEIITSRHQQIKRKSALSIPEWP